MIPKAQTKRKRSPYSLSVILYTTRKNWNQNFRRERDEYANFLSRHFTRTPKWVMFILRKACNNSRSLDGKCAKKEVSFLLLTKINRPTWHGISMRQWWRSAKTEPFSFTWICFFASSINHHQKRIMYLSISEFLRSIGALLPLTALFHGNIRASS